MIIVAGYELLDPADRDRYVEAFRDLVRQSRSAPGCRDAAVSADSVDPARVNTFELWDSLDEANAWRATAPVPEIDIAIREAHVLEYEISHRREPFG